MPGTTLKLEVGFDQTPDLAIPLIAFLFTRAGRLVASAPVTEGRASLAIEAIDRRDLRLFIAPAPGEGEVPPTIASMEKINAYEPTWTTSPAGAVKLQPIPKILWKRWIATCRVRGRVVVPTLVGGVLQDLPLPHARVRIFEVDPYWILLRRIPPAQIFKLRDDLLKMTERKWIPMPDPSPDPEPGPEPWGPAAIRALAGSALGEAPAAAAATMSPAALADALSEVIPQRSRIALLSPSVDVVSSALGQHMELLWPILCRWHWHWPWLWPLLRTHERRVVETDAQGLFDVTILYLPFGDHPDLYFQVDFWIDGAFSPVYKPSVRCHTWWNIPSGSEVTLRVRDPRVSGAIQAGAAPPGSVLVERIGSIWVNTIANGRTASMGLAGVGLTVKMPHAFGGVLAPHVEFSPALMAAGVTHFRWSYQRIKDDGAPLSADEPWRVVTAPLSRIYMEIVNESGAEKWRRQSVALGPVAVGDETVFSLPPDKPPLNVGQLSAWWDCCRNNEASAFLDTRLINAASEAPAGLVKLRLELFRLNAGKLERVAPGGGFHVPPPGYDGTGDMTAIPGGAAFVESVHDGLCPGGTSVDVFVLKKVQFDNRAAEAKVLPATLPGVQTGCAGLLSFTGDPSATNVQVIFKAEQAGGFGAYAFDVRLGFVGQSPVQTLGIVREVGADPLFSYDASARTYRRSVTASALLTHSHASYACICPPMPPAGSTSLCPEATRHATACTPGAGALSEAISVYAAVTNGYERLWELDRYDHAGFALVHG